MKVELKQWINKRINILKQLWTLHEETQFQASVQSPSSCTQQQPTRSPGQISGHFASLVVYSAHMSI